MNLTFTNCPAYNISARIAQKAPFLCLCLRPLSSNSRYLFVLRSFPSDGSTCDIAPSLRVFVMNSLQAYRHLFFSESCACDVVHVIGQVFLPCSSFLKVITLQLLPLLPLKAARHKRYPDKVQVGPRVPPSSLFFSKGCA
jgi:hypothetical protein